MPRWEVMFSITDVSRVLVYEVIAPDRETAIRLAEAGEGDCVQDELDGGRTETTKVRRIG